MKPIFYPPLGIILMLLLIPSNVFTQEKSPPDSQETMLREAAREIINAAGTCALISLDGEGRPRARTMDPFPPEDDFTVWFGTNSKSRKVEQIKNDPRVTIYYLDDDQSGYVMVHGTASLVNDPLEKKKKWKEEWEAFYPDKNESYLLIKVKPEWLEISSPKRGIHGNPTTWQPATIKFNNILKTK